MGVFQEHNIRLGEINGNWRTRNPKPSKNLDYQKNLEVLATRLFTIPFLISSEVYIIAKPS
jgi:hypothetical protein